MDEEEHPILTGYLTIKAQNGFSIRISKKPKYCQLFKASRNGIERLEISDSESDKNTRIVTLENCVKIILEQPPTNVINIVTKTGQIQMHSANDITIKQWKVALQSIAFREKPAQNSILARNAIVEEDNDLYCSSYSEGIFTVTLIPTDASIKCGLEPKMYTLMLSDTEIQLKYYDDESIIIAKWPYRFIRKYGYRDGKFTFEAGRKCDTGEGTFKLDNANPQEIFRCMSTRMKSMKKNISGDSFSSTSSQSLQHPLSSVFSLEPGSRSPLPPTPQGNSFIDVDSHSSFRGILSSPELNAAIKNGIPNKPPRRTVPPAINNQTPYKSHSSTLNISSVFIKNSNVDSLNEQSDASNSNQPVPLPFKSELDYECVEDITEAWRKLGIDDVKHTENTSASEEELREFVRSRSKSSREFKTKFYLENNAVTDDLMSTKNQLDENYDKLDFFRTTHKVSSGYKTIVPIKAQSSMQKQGITASDDYEIVGDPTASTVLNTMRSYSSSTSVEGFDSNANQMAVASPDTSACRTADDSYLGYGIIRKSSLPAHSPSTSTNLCNNDEPDKIHRFDYATVSKPKRV